MATLGQCHRNEHSDSFGLSKLKWFTACVLVNGAVVSFPDMAEETSEWVTAIGGERQPAHTHTRARTHHHVEWADGEDRCILNVCVSRGLCGVLASGEGSWTTGGGGGRLPEGAAGGAEGVTGESV